jgi:hypothetical protein
VITLLYRPVAILKAKPGREHAFLDFTLEVLPLIHRVDGLRRALMQDHLLVLAEIADGQEAL